MFIFLFINCNLYNFIHEKRLKTQVKIHITIVIKNIGKFIMNIVKNIDQYDENFLYFCDPIKNTIMNEGKFIRILYSSPTFILNGIYLKFHLNDVNIEKYYNKYKCTFNVNSHYNLIQNVKTIEENLLKKINIPGKISQTKIYEQLANGNIKIFNEISYNKNFNNFFLLKISGIWETDTQYGVTYKFSKLNL